MRRHIGRLLRNWADHIDHVGAVRQMAPYRVAYDPASGKFVVSESRGARIWYWPKDRAAIWADA